jgi:glutamine cyclotransferase
MEDNKITLKIKLAILVILAISYYIMFFYGHEDKKSDHSITKNNPNVKITPEILFETDDFTVLKKIVKKQLTFTQGLFMDTDGTIIESGGLYGKSVLQRYNVDTPDDYLFKIDIPSQYFAEGSTLFNGRIYLLTWREKKV